jgi:2-C-methyl-D-erythritol 4-phosphate cytidylyltransferase
MTVALIVAAGSGRRLGASSPKALVQLHGRPMLAWSLTALSRTPGIERIVVAMPAGRTELPEGLELDPQGPPVSSVQGGATRSESVRLALAAAGPGDPVLVQDAARPLLTPEVAEAVIGALTAEPSIAGAIAAAAVTDTIKRADEHMNVTETLSRNELWAIQTPQVFRREALERALDVDSSLLAGATDDASLLERAGERIVLVPCPPENIKVTTPADLELAALLLTERSQADG